MNRILIDERLNDASLNKDILTVNINKDSNYLINNLSKKYVINIKNSNVNILSLIDNDSNLDIIINVDNSSVTYNLIGYNFKNQNIIINLNTRGSSVEIYNSIISINSQEANINVFHNAPKTISNIYNCAVTKDSGSVEFNVVSKVMKEMKSSVINQESKIISLNSSNYNKINPVLLIDEYDVIAKHSAFIGKFKDEEVFYMQTRGIKKKEAYNLLLKGFLLGFLKVSEKEKEEIIKIYDNWR